MYKIVSWSLLSGELLNVRLKCHVVVERRFNELGPFMCLCMISLS